MTNICNCKLAPTPPSIGLNRWQNNFHSCIFTLELPSGSVKNVYCLVNTVSYILKFLSVGGHFMLSVWNHIYPVHGVELSLKQLTRSAYPYPFVFLVWHSHSFFFVILCLYCFIFFVFHLNVGDIILVTAFLWAAMHAALFREALLWRHNDMAVIASWNTCRPEREPRDSDHRLSIN